MRYALISDVHANLPALDAVLDDIAHRPHVDATYHLGDIVGYAPWPNETATRLQEARIEGVSGNYDSTVASNYMHCGCRYEDPRQEELSHVSFEWTKRHVTDDTRRYLGSLPFRLDVRPLGGHASGPTVVLVHGTPTLNTVYWTEDRSDAFCSQMAKVAGLTKNDVIAFGHTHKPWYRGVDGVHFVNTGSVGRPKDGDWRAGYVLLEVDARDVHVEVVRVEYDLERAMEGVRSSGLPADFAEYLASGGMKGQGTSSPAGHLADAR